MADGWAERRKARKHLEEALHHARHLRNMREDVMPEGDRAELSEAIAAAAAALRERRDAAGFVAARQALEAVAAPLSPPRRGPLLENFEVLAVALGVAMAFRCYFFQPFQIPTGSMQPTLYGIHSEQRAPGRLDAMPFKPLQWLATGQWYREVRVVAGGTVQPVYNDDRKPGYVAFQVGSSPRRYYVPSDAVRDRGEVRFGPNVRIQPGAVLWAGTVTWGDHVFVNRVVWNFRRPTRGEIMVFSTRGIAELPQGTHYIKRMTGLPGETVSIHEPDLWIDGEPVRTPETIARVAERRKLADWAPAYEGYTTIGNYEARFARPLRTAADSITLGPREYYAMGDNTHNSRDSRFWGPVPARNLLGPACLVYWPFTSPRWGGVR